MSHKNLVVINVDKQTKAVERAGFGVMNILGVHKVFHERIQFYSSITEVASAGFNSNDPEYIAANAAFSQAPRVQKIAISTRHADDTDIKVTTVADNTDYIVTINAASGTKTTFTYDSGVGATANSIAAGLAALIPGASGLPVTASALADTVTISSNPSGTLYSVSIDSTNLTMQALVATETIDAAASAIVLVDNTWYAMVTTSRTQSEVETLASWVESNSKLFLTASSDTNIIDTTALADTTSLAATIKASAYERTGVMYHSKPESFPDAAWFGKQLPTDPGSSTWGFKTLAGIVVDNLTTTQQKNAHEKYAATYTLEGGVNIVFEGKVGSGEYIDIVRGIDWLTSEMKAAIFSRKVNLPKIPHDDGGYSIIQTEIKKVLENGITVGLLSDNPAPVVTVPLSINVSTLDKAGREFNDTTWQATLKGAIHFTTIGGTVTV